MSWLITSFVWYLYLFAIGLIFFPLCAKIFSIFYDRGYAFAKTIGIILLSYTLFLLGLIRVVPFSQESIFFSLILIGFVIYRYCKNEIKIIKTLSWRRKLVIIGEEVLFFLAFLFLVVVRGQEPSIRGLEKFMDFGFMQSILRSDYFPPLDMWLSADLQNPNGYAINYYYFGHLTGALLIKLSGISPFIGYNLILATIMGQGVVLAYSLTSNIIFVSARHIFKKYLNPLFVIGYGLLGTFLVNLAGNLHTIYIFTTGYPNEEPVPFWGIFQNGQDLLKGLQATNGGLFDALIYNSKYWYPNATRFIPFTIHEFPSYSYVVADLHGHVFDIPFVLITFAFLFLFFVRTVIPELRGGRLLKSLHPVKKSQILSFVLKPLIDSKFTFFEVGIGVLIGFMIAINYMTNAFDGPIYLLLALISFFIVYRIGMKAGKLSVLLGLSFIIFSLPFSLFFKPFASGIGVNCSPTFLVNLTKVGPFLFEKGNCQISAWWMLFILWGFFWIAAVLYGIYLYLNSRHDKKWWTSLDLWIVITFAFGTFLILVPEFFYIKDIYPAHYRANTMFKMGYQAYMMMSITVVLVLYRIGTWQSKKKYILKMIYAPFVILVSIYPFIAFPSYYPSLNYAIQAGRAPVLDGSLWMGNDIAQDKEIVDYIQDNITGQPIILEAQGDSYTDYNRVSAYTGLPTVAGWWVHQWLWRGSPEVVGARIPDIEALYQSEDVDLTRNLLRKYDISYIVISAMEREKYPTLNEDKFKKLGVKIFESSNRSGALYKVY